MLELSYFPKNNIVAIKLVEKRLLTAAAIYPASGYTIILEYYWAFNFVDKYIMYRHE